MEHEEAENLKVKLTRLALPTPGLKWRKRANGVAPYWIARSDIVKAGYPIRARNLEAVSDDPAQLSRRCVILQGEMLQWLRQGEVRDELKYDGTFTSLLRVYEAHPESTFNTRCKPETQRSYGVYLKKLKRHVGEVRVDKTNGLDIKRWFDVWADREQPGKKGSPYRTLGAGRMALAVLMAAVGFGVEYGLAGCAELMMMIKRVTKQLPEPKPRQYAPTAADVEKIRAAAHAAGAPRRAFAYALQFETQLRQWDVIGTWVDLSDPRPSTFIDHGKKWIGPKWSDLDGLLLPVTPGKTAERSNARACFDLSVCPMVMQELAHIPEAERTGPLVINEATGGPYVAKTFQGNWQRDFRAAGMPKGMWNRDLRAGGNTEASEAGARQEDRAKVAAHSEWINAKVYDRDTVEAHRRVMAERVKRRTANGG
jgi:hypothetical protein